MLWRLLLQIAATLLPVVTIPSSGLVVTSTQGYVTIGSKVLSVPAGQVTITDNETSCDAPTYAACNLIYVNGSTGRVSTTTVVSAAYAPGNYVLVLMTTLAGTVTSGQAPSSAFIPPPGFTITLPTLQLPICNVIFQQGCQPCVRNSLSCYDDDEAR